MKMVEEECSCKLLRSCSNKCRGEHREKDKEECQKQVAKMHDDDLFRQPEKSHLGECPLCFLPMPLDIRKSTFKSCCSQLICDGCVFANFKSNGSENCPFCREPAVNGDEENYKRVMERVKANDPAAMREMGIARYNEGDYDTAFEYYTKAAELGDVIAHYQLSVVYRKWEGVEKDEEKAVYHWEEAVVGGHPTARYNLGCCENDNGNADRAVKHFIIAANLGYEKSMKVLWEYYKHGDITKEDLEATLRTHQAALDEMKSPEREAAEELQKRLAKQKRGH